MPSSTPYEEQLRDGWEPIWDNHVREKAEYITAMKKDGKYTSPAAGCPHPQPAGADQPFIEAVHQNPEPRFGTPAVKTGYMVVPGYMANAKTGEYVVGHIEKPIPKDAKAKAPPGPLPPPPRLCPARVGIVPPPDVSHPGAL